MNIVHNDTQPKDRHTQCPVTPEITELGKATELTHGSPLITPWYENGIPPYNYWLPPE